MNYTATAEPQKGRRRPAILSGLTPYAGTFGRPQLIHLLKRTMFGAKLSDITFFENQSLNAVLTALLTPDPAPTTQPLKDYGATGTNPDPNIALGATWVNDIENPNANGQRRNSLKSWWIGQMLNQSRSIHEKMVLFWHNHFATELDSSSAIAGYWHNLMLRRNALGNFKTFTKEVTLDPLMLNYLNGRLNNKNAPDENYARELQELFTLGKGPGSQYTEEDVQAAAKVLTGYTIVAQTTTTPMTYAFNATRHDTTNKAFSSFFNNTIITGRTGAAGEQELDDLLNMIFAQEEVAKYMCRRLYTFFVYYEITADVETNIISPLADIFRNSGYDILPVLRALLQSEHFFDTANYSCVIKSPVDYYVGAAREFGFTIPTDMATQYVEIYRAWRSLATACANANQDIGDPPSVSGWRAYYQAPLFHEYWIDTDTIGKRLKYMDSMFTTTGVTIGTNLKMLAPAVTYTEQFGADAANPNTLIDKVLENIYRLSVSTNFKNAAKALLLSGQTSDQYWTDAWNAYRAAPSNTTLFNTVNTRLMAFYRFLHQQAEYQLS